MFCIQCEQTLNSPVAKGCIFTQGMCGKTAEVSDLQDVLVKYLQGISFWAKLGADYGYHNQQVNRWSPQAFFSTLTNVNFDPARMYEFISEARSYKSALEKEVRAVVADHSGTIPALTVAASLDIPAAQEAIIQFAPMTSLNQKKRSVDDVLAAYLLCLYGLKGAAAYMEHAAVLGQTDDEVCAQYHGIMSYLGDAPDDLPELLQTALKIGELNYRVMFMLDKGETSRFGDPEPTSVNIGHVKGKCILVSGHDLEDLYEILVQTQDKGINVYTHGEMLPAHGYPELRAFKHLVGNYGTAWQKQQKEFADFPGAIVMTSNCIINPDVGGYKNRIFTRSIVGWPGAHHVVGNDFSEVINCALSLEGFREDAPAHLITVGFGRAALAQAAPAVIQEIRAGNVKHVFLVGGCDGDRRERNYYTDFAQKTPENTLMLTLACGKYRFNQHDFGNINGIPRLLDVGQCNDSYSAIQLALALAEEFQCGVNDLPLTLVVSWFEQKAIAVLLTLLALGVRGIYLGPSLPVFLTPDLLQMLVETFDIRPISDPDSDLKVMLNS